MIEWFKGRKEKVLENGRIGYKIESWWKKDKETEWKCLNLFLETDWNLKFISEGWF